MSSQPPYPAAPPPAGKTKLRGRIPLRLSLIFGVIGVALIVVGAILFANGLSTSDFKRIAIDGQQHSVKLTRTGSYIGYFESPSSASHRANIRFAIQDSDGTAVKVSLYGSNTTLTYDLDGRHGEAVFTFSIKKAGTYQVAAESSDAASGSRMALGESIAGALVGGLATLIPGVFLVIVAVVLLIVGIFRRRGHKKQLANPYGGYPPPPGGYPQGGYQPAR